MHVFYAVNTRWKCIVRIMQNHSRLQILQVFKCFSFAHVDGIRLGMIGQCFEGRRGSGKGVRRGGKEWRVHKQDHLK